MPGKRITDQQVSQYKKLRSRFSQEVAAAKIGVSVRTARRIEKLPALPSQSKPRDWRTRADPLADAWEVELLPLLQSAPGLTAVTLLEELQQRHPGQFDAGVLRTLQRRIRRWRALEGDEREVFFAQQHEPGRLGLSNFTDARELRVSIGGEPLEHRYYQFTLAYSGWRHVEVVLGGESWVALSAGLQNALWALGGVPVEHRTDSLSAAFNNLAEQDELRRRYEELCERYGMRASRNNPGASHENGAIEARQGTTKHFVEQALLLRGSREFDSLQQYRRLIAEVAARANARVIKALAVEQACLRPLPVSRCADYEEIDARVTKFGLISVKKVMYSVPSRLIGHRLKVRVYDDRIEAMLGRHGGAEHNKAAPAARRPTRQGGRLPAHAACAQAQASRTGALAAARCAVSAQRVCDDLAAAHRAAARAAGRAPDDRLAGAGRRPRLRSGAGCRAGAVCRTRRAARSATAGRPVCAAPGAAADRDGAAAVAGGV